MYWASDQIREVNIVIHYYQGQGKMILILVCCKEYQTDIKNHLNHNQKKKVWFTVIHKTQIKITKHGYGNSCVSRKDIVLFVTMWHYIWIECKM